MKIRQNNNLHRLISTEDWSLAKLHCDSHPKEAKSWTNQIGFWESASSSDVLPLHQATMLNASRELVDSLIKAYPQAVRAKESLYDRIPLHIACLRKAEPLVVWSLVLQYPQGAGMPDRNGRLPIHFACNNNAPVFVIRSLLRACPGSARAFDNVDGWLPLHVACDAGASPDCIAELLNVYPESAVLQTKKGNTPQSLLDRTKNEHSEEIIDLLETAIQEQSTEAMVRSAIKSDGAKRGGTTDVAIGAEFA